MRQGIKDFKEFHNKEDWSSYVSVNMGKAAMEVYNDEIHVKTKRHEVIAVWQNHGYGYVQECRTKERLEALRELSTIQAH